MRPVTATFLASVRGSHRMIARARLVAPGQTGTTPTGLAFPGGDPAGLLPISAGDVTTDMTADVQSTLALTTLYPWPGDPFAAGTPYGQEIYVERGIEYGTGTREYVGLGYFRIDSVKQQQAPNGPITIAASDRMAQVKDSRNVSPQTFAAGGSVGACIDTVVQQAVPGAVTDYGDWDAYGTSLASAHVMGDDRLPFLQDLLAAYGRYAFFDYRGVYTVRPVPDVTTQEPVWTIDAGRHGVLVEQQRTISRDAVYNVVVARGEPVGELPPVQGLAYDNNPASPTYVFGSFGIVPTYYSSSFMTTIEQCEGAAAAQLAKATGLPYSVSLGTVPNPALEGWDVVTVDNGRDNAETHVLDRITYGLTPDSSMGMDTRKQYLEGVP
ncbi:DUF5047 domain-containing protein [Amycolatopsis jiangsuensis]|uniref:DUF5047 domain-containing protein n=1 Tax=Amycolatopsis jiangsuensis TaxID=1181879 RepID=A0A840J440_9PSEU|nr:DUF5047 domain-containing protein [Amycolatopsis jiangsuensis]MBB4689831.1 hypothetical protein [Amycolatopsis jiangsuensis]